MLKESTLNFLGLKLEIKTEESFSFPLFQTDDEYSIPATIKTFDGSQKNMLIHLDTHFLIEEDIKDHAILAKYDLSTIVCIIVRRESQASTSLEIFYPHEVSFKFWLENNALDYLISLIIHNLNPQPNVDSAPTILMDPINLKKVIYAFDESDSSFEVALMQEIEDVFSLEQFLDPKTQDLLEDAALNISFKSLGYDSKVIGSLFRLLRDMMLELMKLESNKDALDAYDTLLAALGKPLEKPIPESGQMLFILYQRLPPLLAIIRNIVLWRSNLPEITIFQEQVETLVNLSISKDSIIACEAVHTLRVLLLVLKSIFKLNS